MLHPFFCALLHHRFRTVIIPGLLPWKLDATCYCEKCDRGKGQKRRDVSLHRMPSAFAAGAA